MPSLSQLMVMVMMVQVLGMLSAEARASRLSFNDVIKRLGEQDDSQPTFISKKVGFFTCFT